MKLNEKTKLALINAAIAGGLVFAGSFSSGMITKVGVIAALSASCVIFLAKMKAFFAIKGKKGLSAGLFEFI